MTDTHANASLNDEPIDDEITQVLRDLKYPANKDAIVDAARAAGVSNDVIAVFDHAHAHTVEALHQPTLHHHGWAGYDELLRVPLVIRMPGTVPKATVAQQVSFVDIEPTIRDLVGIAERPGSRGRSLAPLWRGQAEAERPAFVEGQDVRVVRAETKALRQRDFVLAAYATGATNARILFAHILPNVASVVIVLATFEVARAIILESALSFLGLGVPQAIPSWGAMLADGRQFLDTAWWIGTFPGLAIMLTVLGVNIFGDGLRDYVDPHSRGR